MSVLLSELLGRIALVSGRSYPSDRRSLLHAYIACFSYSDLCTAIATTLGAPTDVRLALRSRLLRLVGEGHAEQAPSILVNLVEQTTSTADEDKTLRPAADALHSAVFEHLPLPTKQMLLDRWIDRSTRGAMARWLKATEEQPDLFDADIALAYWRSTKDVRAIKRLAYQASPRMLHQIMPEVIQNCAEGWIISRIVIRAGFASKECWQEIQDSHPATYLYLCAHLHRPISDEEAFELVCRCSGLAFDGDRGLAIWAIGQMGIVSVLDRVLEAEKRLQEQDLEELFIRTSKQ